jgi:pilus assembly protein CpaF
VTTISIAGADHVYVRYEHGALVETGRPFDDEPHLRRILARMLMRAGAELRDDQPYVEVGLTVNERPASINLLMPPIAYNLNADIRVHPRHAPTLDDLVLGGVCSEDVATWLRTLARSGQGFMVVGETESGKTTLLSALVGELPAPETMLTVERASELRLPPEAQRLMTHWPVGEDVGISFGAQIDNALLRSPGCLVLDEVRADEPLTIAPLLESPHPPRQIWTFRGVADSKRLQSALGMLARRADFGSGEALVHALYERLPFVVTVARIRERIQLFSIAEWQPNPASDYPDFVLLFQYQDGQARPTGRASVHRLPGIW